MKTWQTEIHLLFLFAGLAGLVVACAAAGVYLFQRAQLKSKHPGSLFQKLPSLDQLDRLHFAALASGIVLFTLGILSGLFLANDPSKLRTLLEDPKVIVSMAACMLYWVILALRVFALGRGQKIAVSTVLVFVLFMAVMADLMPAQKKAFHEGYENGNNGTRTQP